jgi:hypothetical protein
MKSVQGDSGHAQVKMVADIYSHIIDDDRCLNAQRFENAFYSGRTAAKQPWKQVSEASSCGRYTGGNQLGITHEAADAD